MDGIIAGPGPRRGWRAAGRPGARVAVGLVALSLAGCAGASSAVVATRNPGAIPETLDLPGRPVAAPTGPEVVDAVRDLPLADREDRVVEEVLSGNVPEWLRTFVPIRLVGEIDGRRYDVELQVLPDYLSVGSSADFVRMPLSPQAAQRIADRTETSLPTPRIADAVWQAARVRLRPAPIPPSDAMTTVPVFVDHHRMVEAAWPPDVPRGLLVAGIKKDVVLSARLAGAPGRVAIYGWHHPDGRPIQPVYTGHTDRWVDYSHGVRLIHRRVVVDGEPWDLPDLLADPVLAALLSGEGPLEVTRYGPADVR